MALCYLTEKRISADFMQHLVVPSSPAECIVVLRYAKR